MTVGYIRQSSAEIQPSLAINAEDLNAEFDQLASAFDSTSGHDHSGSVSGDGAKIGLTTAVTGALPVANGGTGLTTSPITTSLGGTGVTDGSNLLPPGVIMPYVVTSPPTGWLVCNGGGVSRSTYAALFAIIGTNFGSGDGVTTFNVPDLRGSVIAGYDPSNATGRLTTSVSAASIGNFGGEQSHILSTDELAVHTHNITDAGHNHNVTDPAHSHNVTDPGHSHTYGSANSVGIGGEPAASGTGVKNNALNTTTDSTNISIVSSATGLTVNTNTTGIVVNNSTGGSAHNNTQPTFILMYIIKT